MDKYDRQVRLWSGDGQARLRSAHIYIIGISASAIEAAKNLVLAGAGRVTISEAYDSRSDTQPGPSQTDSATNNSQKRTHNFFSANRRSDEFVVDALVRNLRELNPDVHVGSARNTLKVLDDSVTTVIVDFALNTPHLLKKCELLDIPIIEVEARGLDGRVRLLADEICIVQPNPDPATAVDLRFTGLWPDIRRWVDSIDLDTLGDVEHAHVPFVALLVKALDTFTGDITTRSGQREFKNHVRAFSRYPDEENVDEAVRQAWRVWREDIPAGVWDVIKYKGPRHNSAFWALTTALEEFIKRHHVLPVAGTVPDMVTDTEQYLRVKSLYAAKAEEDAREIASLAPELVPIELVRVFCRNSRHIQAIVRVPEEKRNEVNDPLPQEPEIAPVAAIIGGIAAQEATKIVTGQYTPLIGAVWFRGGTHTTEIDEGSLRLLNG